MSGQHHWAHEKARRSINPPQVESTLRRLEERWPSDAPSLPAVVAEFPLGEAALLHLLAISSICAARLVKEPRVLLWLSRPDICSRHRGKGRMIAELEASATGPIGEANFRALRLWKGREMLRIALREVAEVASLEETMTELSQLADICLTQVHDYWNADLRQKAGSPDTSLTILGLGKLGSKELNHSSDIDVICFYGEDGSHGGKSSNHEWCNRLVAKIVQTFSVIDEAGPLFRIDLRLRPEGSAGPLARSLDSMENYYAGFGESWERLMLMKARGICGDSELAYEFLHRHQPFIYPKNPTPDLLDEIAAIKLRIERDLVGHENLDRDVKLGSGGIREIEFIVQSLQLLHGARHAFLQEPSTLKVLDGLADLDLLPREDARALEEAYRFLRKVEHRLQIEAEQQTHTVPEDPESVRRLAASLQFPSADAFMDELRGRMRRVASTFDRIVSEPRDEGGRPPPLSAIFRDEKRAAQTIAALVENKRSFHIAPRTQQVFRRLQPLLLAQLSGTADPDMTLTQFVRFIEAYGMRSMLFELLVTNPRLLELLIRTFDASRFASELLIRRPQLLEEITRQEEFARPVTTEEHLQQLRETEEADRLQSVRLYRQAQLLRILLRDVLGFAKLNEIHKEHTALAEACLLFMTRDVLPDFDLTIIALGKFGGEEISYGADLDVLFVGENLKAAHGLLGAMAQPTSEGSIYPLDARLRPDGEKGPLVCSLESYRFYYESRAQFWEVQSLTRARPLHGPLCDPFMTMARSIWEKAGQREDLHALIDGMLERIQRDRSSGKSMLDFKTGTGGIVVAEFLVQALQMRSNTWAPNWLEAINALTGRGLLAPEESAQLRSSYELLRRLESALRRWENKSVSTLPGDETEQYQLARRLGFESAEAFRRQYISARETIDAIYKRRMGQSASC